MYYPLQAHRPESFYRKLPPASWEDPLPEVKFPGKPGIAQYTAANKAGTPVTQARIVILLNDKLPAFAIQTATLGKTPHLLSGVGGLGGKRIALQSKGKHFYVSLPGHGERGNGGVLFLPGTGKSTIHLLTWNVGRLSINRNAGNESHAEMQFLNWIKAHLHQYPEFINRIRAIHVFINNSPCGGCTDDLCAFARRYNLGSKIKISWNRNYNRGTDSTANLRKLRQCGIRASPPIASEILAAIKPRLGNLKLARQQQHTCLPDAGVRADKPQAENRAAGLMRNPHLGSSLSRFFARPQQYVRVKRLFQGLIDLGLYRQRTDGGYEAVLTFKYPTGWSYGQAVNRLKVIVDQKGNWYYYPVP